jgi:hypothetical protein
MLIRQEKFAGISFFQTHISRVTGQFSPTQFLIFLLSKWVGDNFSAWYICQIFFDLESFTQLICFFVFFHANLLSASKFTGLGWLVCLLSVGQQIRAVAKFISPNTKHYVKA